VKVHPSSWQFLSVLMICFLVASLPTPAGAQKKSRLSAPEMMQKAHENRAQWDDFPGFSADLVVFADTQRAAGQITVSAEGDIELQLTEDESFSWISEDLQSLVSHRLPQEDREYNVSFVAGQRATGLGRLIQFNEDRMHSVYRVRGNVITEVHRTMDPKKMLISVIDVRRNPEKKYLPRSYSVTWTDAKTGKLLSTTVVNNQWVRVGRLDLPSRVLKVIDKEDGSREVHDLRLSNHKLTTE